MLATPETRKMPLLTLMIVDVDRQPERAQGGYDGAASRRERRREETSGSGPAPA